MSYSVLFVTFPLSIAFVRIHAWATQHPFCVFTQALPSSTKWPQLINLCPSLF